MIACLWKVQMGESSSDGGMRILSTWAVHQERRYFVFGLKLARRRSFKKYQRKRFVRYHFMPRPKSREYSDRAATTRSPGRLLKSILNNESHPNHTLSFYLNDKDFKLMFSAWRNFGLFLSSDFDFRPADLYTFVLFWMGYNNPSFSQSYAPVCRLLKYL